MLPIGCFRYKGNPSSSSDNQGNVLKVFKVKIFNAAESNKQTLQTKIFEDKMRWERILLIPKEILVPDCLICNKSVNLHNCGVWNIIFLSFFAPKNDLAE